MKPATILLSIRSKNSPSNPTVTILMKNAKAFKIRLAEKVHKSENKITPPQAEEY
jgi:hypothetical protein